MFLQPRPPAPASSPGLQPRPPAPASSSGLQPRPSQCPYCFARWPWKRDWMGGGGVPNSVFNKKCCAYSWFGKWNITLIQYIRLTPIQAPWMDYIQMVSLHQLYMYSLEFRLISRANGCGSACLSKILTSFPSPVSLNSIVPSDWDPSVKDQWAGTSHCCHRYLYFNSLCFNQLIC